jgi:hypothetical protein
MPNIEVSKEWAEKTTAERASLFTALDELAGAVRDAQRRSAAGDPHAIESSMLAITLRAAEIVLLNVKTL